MKKAFTLIELVVAVSLLAMVFLFAGVIFKVSINAYRTAVANAEIMQKLRAITDQLNADFKGYLWSPKSSIFFGTEKSEIDGGLVDVRSDSIVFFANGDFQSTRQYPSTSGDKTVVGNVAGIFYGLAADTSTDDPREKILVRRQTILTSDTSLTQKNLIDLKEYCTQSLAELIADPLFDANDLMDRPSVDPTNLSEDDLVMYMAKGVDNFTIQYVGVDTSSKEFNEWRPDDEELGETRLDDFAPKAFKFTFTLYDSKGVIKEGRTFTYIVYIGD